VIVCKVGDLWQRVMPSCPAANISLALSRVIEYSSACLLEPERTLDVSGDAAGLVIRKKNHK
jgi:hypothetical protein